MWKKTKKWGPPRATTSTPIAVERTDSDATLGLAKQRGMVNEKLASDVAVLAQVRVPKVELDRIEGMGGADYAISHVHSVESVDLTHVRQLAAVQFNSAAVQEAIGAASGLLAFYAWVRATDLKDDHLVLDREADGTYRITGVDFETSFRWREADGGQVGAPVVPPALVPKIDKARVDAAVASIEAATDDAIREIVNASSALVSDPDKERLANGLIGRGGKIREQMKAQGWLP